MTKVKKWKLAGCYRRSRCVGKIFIAGESGENGELLP
jgi:hypothetical protein